MTTLTRHRGNSLFDTVFSDLFNDEFITRPYMSAAKRNSQVLNRDEDWQIVFAIPGVKKHEVAVKVDECGRGSVRPYTRDKLAPGSRRGSRLHPPLPPCHSRSPRERCQLRRARFLSVRHRSGCCNLHELRRCRHRRQAHADQAGGCAGGSSGRTAPGRRKAGTSNQPARLRRRARR